VALPVFVFPHFFLWSAQNPTHNAQRRAIKYFFLVFVVRSQVPIDGKSIVPSHTGVINTGTVKNEEVLWRAPLP